MLRFILVSLSFIFLFATDSIAQIGTIKGHVRDEKNNPLELVNVVVIETNKGTITDKNGFYTLTVPSDTTLTLAFQYMGYGLQKHTFKLKDGETHVLTAELEQMATNIGELVIKNNKYRSNTSIYQINPKTAIKLANPSGNIEGILKTLPGVSSNNELSSQYSVRGGNFDENLVYVNDFQIYRPFLVRSSQQEGLSFINPDLVESLSFSSGGFEAKYGDKLSSVLDIKYKKPDSLAGSVSASLMGVNFHLEGSNKKNKLHYLLGLRYKTNQSLLNGQETIGEYRPSFTDLQGLISYDLNKKLAFELIANYSRNFFQFIPKSRQTEFGVVNNVLRLDVYFEGQEIIKYQSMMGGLSATYKPSPRLNLKWLASAYIANEEESFDVLGYYRLDEIESNLGSEDFGQSRRSLGYGTYQDFARNNLNAFVSNIAHKGDFELANHFIQWGAKYQIEFIEDKFKEWNRLDSSGYSIPFSSNEVLLNEVLKTSTSLQSRRYTAFLQNSFTPSDNNRLTIKGGVRAHYWDMNHELLFSPRAQLSYKPRWKKDFVFKASIGMYHQPPFYRELRDLYGVVNKSVKAQRSAQAVIGGDWEFKVWDRPFKFISEVYYKHLYNIIPYEIENVRIRYFGENLANGYAVGADFRIYGEFVKGAESWFSLSVMQTQEDIKGDFFYNYYNKDGALINGSVYDRTPTDSVRIEPGYIPRPTDQRVQIGIFFQDYLPRNENFKMSLNLVFGTGLPFGPTDKKRYNDLLRIPPYRRVDIGFSALLFDKTKNSKIKKGILKGFESIWASVEVFNLLQADNTVSYIWVKDVTNTNYAVPNHLTSRRLNTRLVVNF